MKLSTINSRLITAATAVFAAFVAFAADVSDVIVRQQWPWSTDIKVEFKLTNVTTPVTVNVEASDGDTPLDTTNLKNAITGDLWGISQSGVYTFKIDPKIAFGEGRNAVGDFKVRLSLTDEPTADDILYKIVDLTKNNTWTDVRRRDFYNGKYGKFVTKFSDIDSTFSTSLDDVLIWLDVTNEVYKTDKMVFRRIPAAGKSYSMQTNNSYNTVNGGAGVEVSFAKDFYIGVYEVTQTQLNKFYRWWGNDRAYSSYPPRPSPWNATYCNSFETNEAYRAMRPAGNIGVWTGYGHCVRDISNSTLANHNVGSGSFCGNMQQKTGLLVDLPTEAMWEYACRAGTSTDLYTGQVFRNGSTYYYARLDKICRRYKPTTDRNCDLSVGSAIVGSFKPNAWGLYDMIGNIGEWCLDKEVAAGSLPGGTDPLYAASTSKKHVVRGGCWNFTENNSSCFYRYIYNADYEGNVNTKGFGIRLCIYLDNNDDGTL